MRALIGVQCAMCKTACAPKALYVCDQCLGPLEAVYDYDLVRREMTRESIEARPNNLWR